MQHMHAGTNITGIGCFTAIWSMNMQQWVSVLKYTNTLEALEWRIQFKLATLTFKALHTGRPPYLTDLLQHH